MRINRMLRTFAAIVLVLLVSTTAFAQTPTPTPRASADGLADTLAIGQADAANVTATFQFTTGGSFTFATGAYVNLVKLPKGAVITDWYLSVPDIDSGTSLTLSLGISSAPTLLLSASTVGQAGGIVSITSTGAAALPAAVITEDRMLRLTATAGNAGAGAGGVLKGWVTYNMRGRAF